MTTIVHKRGTANFMTEPRTVIGRLIQDLRNERGISQMKLADLAALDPSYISRIEQGKRKPEPPVLIQIATAMNVDPARLFIATGYLPSRVTEQIEHGQLSVSAVQAALIEGLLNR